MPIHGRTIQMPENLMEEENKISEKAEYEEIQKREED